MFFGKKTTLNGEEVSFQNLINSLSQQMRICLNLLVAKKCSSAAFRSNERHLVTNWLMVE